MSRIKGAEMLLISFPRSGSHWLCYCLEYITKMYAPRGYRHDGWPAGPDDNPTPNNLLLINTHDLIKSQREAKLGDLEVLPHIMLIRNYKEVVLGSAFDPARPDHIEKINKYLDRFSQNIREHDEMTRRHPDRDLVIYYEDLILSPDSTLNAVIEWLARLRSMGDIPGYPPSTLVAHRSKTDMLSNLSELIQSISEHSDICASGYPARARDDVLHYSRRVIEKESGRAGLALLESLVHEKLGDVLFEKYVARYSGI